MKNSKGRLILLLIICGVLGLAACRPIVAPEQAPTAGSTSASGQGVNLTAQALMNATYSGIYDQPVTLADGRYQGNPPELTVQYLANHELHSDLNGDGAEDAVVFLRENGGGTANFLYVAAQLNQNGQPGDAGAVQIDDRIQVKSAAVEGGQITLEVTTRGPGDADCCASYLTKKTYAFQNGKLAETSSGNAEPVRVSAADLDGSSWRLVELKENEPVADDVEITITFAGDKISGSGGCNKYNTSFALNDVNPFALIFGPIAATRMACPDPAGSQETAYFSALEKASLWGYDFGDLVIAYAGDGNERNLLRFTAQPTAEATAPMTQSLTASTWQWVRLTDPMQQVEIDAPEQYTLTFLADGSLHIQADCNKATAAYTAADDGTLQITPGITTLVACPPGSHGEELLKKLGFAARYFFQDGHLFIDLMADGGTLEFRP